MWGIYRIADLVGDAHVERELEDGRYVRAVPERLPLTLWERTRAAWSVFTQRTVAVIPPKDGELEATLLKSSIEHLVKLLNERGTRMRSLIDENNKLKQQLAEQSKQGT